MLLEKLVSAGIGNRPVVFVTHRSVKCCLCVHEPVAACVSILVFSYIGHHIFSVLYVV